MMHGVGGYGFGMGFGSVFMVLLWVGIIYLLYTLFKGEKKSDTESAVEILKKRYARGDISKEEFEKMKNELQI